MTYMIQARLERGAPSLTLVDAVTGEKRLHWRSDNSINNECDWHSLFKRLMLLSCADRFSLMQRAKSASFGEECIACAGCVDESTSTVVLTSFSTPEAEVFHARSSLAALLRLSQ